VLHPLFKHARIHEVAISIHEVAISIHEVTISIHEVAISIHEVAISRQIPLDKESNFDQGF
jgi:hypothetical protein